MPDKYIRIIYKNRRGEDEFIGRYTLAGSWIEIEKDNGTFILIPIEQIHLVHITPL